MKNLTWKQVVATMIVVFTLSIMVLPVIASAQSNSAENLFDLENAQNIGLGNVALKDTINRIIQVILGFLGLLAVIIILWGGFLWMTAMGDEEKVGKAKSLIIAGIIGIIIILSAFAIARFVITNIGNATGLPDPTT